MLAHIRRVIDGDAISTTEVEDGKLTIGQVFDLCMIARDAFAFDDDIIAELTANIDDWFFDLIELLTCLW